MNGVLPAILNSVLICLVGGLVGAALGEARDMPSLGALLGLLLACTTHAVWQSLRAQKFVRWLRDTSGPAPRNAGLWGEVGYLTERSLRSLERGIVQERLQRTQFLSGIEASPNGVMLLDAHDQIEWCNSVSAQHFNLQRDNDRLQTVTNLIRSPVFVAYMQAQEFDAPVYLGGPGTRQKLMVLVRPYGDAKKLLLSQDVTERDRNEAMRRDFVANVSHEIRTPLTVLAGFIETMATVKLSEAENCRVIELMSQQAQRMQTLVADLLTLAQLEGSPPPSPDRWVGLGGLVRQAEADAQALSGGRHRLSFKGETDVEIAGTESELQSALTNLVSNAIRYTPEGGSVEVRSGVRADGVVELEVQDTGVGIEKGHIPRLTERFYRVDGSRSRETGGTGLGLSIVKHVVQRHGGELQIVSELGKGSVFKLAFPAHRVRYVRAASASLPTAAIAPP